MFEDVREAAYSLVVRSQLKPRMPSDGMLSFWLGGS